MDIDQLISRMMGIALVCMTFALTLFFLALLVALWTGHLYR